jgi:transcriptional regulator with PAS, ATPase and Fis domain
LEEKEIERIGGTTLIRVDFRLIAASNQNLEAMMADGRFRKDLFYRLNVISLNIKPLRERPDDIIPLSRHILEQLAIDYSLPTIEIDSKAEAILMKYDWPGNCRELCNVLERSVSSLEGNVIRPSDLPFQLYAGQGPSKAMNQLSLKDVQGHAERDAILSVLAATNNNKANAARLLGIHRTLLYKKLKKYNIEQ